MPKYYVRSGQLERIVDIFEDNVDNPLRACKMALQSCEGEEIGYYFYVDERGFRGPSNDKLEIDTNFVPSYYFFWKKVTGEQSGTPPS